MLYRFMLYGLLLPFFAKAQVFMRPFDNAAVMGTGGAGVAVDSRASGIVNEAQLGGDAGGRVGLWIGSAVPYGMSGSWQAHWAQAAFRIDRNSSAGIEVLHSGLESYAEQRFRVMYGRRIGERFQLGGSLYAMRVDAKEYGNAMALSFSVGVLAKVLPKVSIGAYIQNPVQQKINEAVIHNTLRIGVAWQTSDVVRIVADIEKDLERRPQIKAGLEYSPIPLLLLRIGSGGSPSRLGMGAGLRLKNGLSIDSGAEWRPPLGVTPALTLSWQKPSR